MGKYIFAGTEGAGVYRSSNNGSTWEPVCSGLKDNVVSALLVNGNTIFAGTGFAAIFKSTDYGNSCCIGSDLRGEKQVRI